MRYDPLIPMLGVVTMIRTDTPDVKTFQHKRHFSYITCIKTRKI